MELTGDFAMRSRLASLWWNCRMWRTIITDTSTNRQTFAIAKTRHMRSKLAKLQKNYERSPISSLLLKSADHMTRQSSCAKLRNSRVCITI